MAIVDNFYLRNQRKKLGGAVYYQAMGQTRSRELAAVVSNPRTTAQMTQRVKWANLVNFYRANQSWMKYAFETKKTNQSDYNKFMSLNVTGSNIYLPKDIAAAGGCVVQAYQITQGSLPSIECIPVDNVTSWMTNIFLEEGMDSLDISVGLFSSALLNMNPGMREGDQLSFIRITQMTNAYNGAPYVIVRKYEVILSRTDTRDLSDFLPLDYFAPSEGVDSNQLMVVNSGIAGGFALILSRTISGKTYVSSQPIMVANNSALITAYSSASALQNAIDSYGSSEDAFLSSVTANQANEAAMTNSIVSIVADTQRLVPGQFFNITKSLATKNFVVICTIAPEDPPQNVRFEFMSGGNVAAIVVSSLTKVGTQITGTFPAAGSLPEDAACTNIRMTLENAEVLEASFLVPNSYTISGLE